MLEASRRYGVAIEDHDLDSRRGGAASVRTGQHDFFLARFPVLDACAWSGFSAAVVFHWPGFSRGPCVDDWPAVRHTCFPSHSQALPGRELDGSLDGTSVDGSSGRPSPPRDRAERRAVECSHRHNRMGVIRSISLRPAQADHLLCMPCRCSACGGGKPETFCTALSRFSDNHQFALCQESSNLPIYQSTNGEMYHYPCRSADSSIDTAQVPGVPGPFASARRRRGHMNVRRTAASDATATEPSTRASDRCRHLEQP